MFLDPVHTLNKLSGYKSIILKSIAFLFINNKLAKREIWRARDLSPRNLKRKRAKAPVINLGECKAL